PGPEQPVQGEPLFGADEKIESIEVLNGEEVRFALRTAADGEWQLAHPVELPADGYPVEALLDVLRAPNARHYPVADANLAELGLEDPEWRLRVNEVELAIGGT